MDFNTSKNPWSRLIKGKTIQIRIDPIREAIQVGNDPIEKIIKIGNDPIGKANQVGSDGSLPNTSYQRNSLPKKTTLKETTSKMTPRLFFNLTTRCMEEVDRLSLSHGSFEPKFNQAQCTYLATKLRLAIQSVSSIIDDINVKFLKLTEVEDIFEFLWIFKLLYTMGVEIVDLIQSCCKESWIQSAIMLTSMSKLITSIGFNLEVCSIVFSTSYMKRTISFLHFNATRIRQVEAKIVKEKADLDEARLIMDLKNVIGSNLSSSLDWQLATFLLRRLEMVPLHQSSTKAGFEDRILPSIMSSLKQMKDCLGRGAFGSVYKAMWLGVEVAKKTFYGPSTSDFLQEVAILDGLNHPNIVSLLWYMSDEKRSHLIMELMDGDLFSLMQQRMEENANQGCPFNIREALDLILQIGEGMLYLHGKRIVHRDLKSHNILIRCSKEAKENVKYLHVKVADFGLSKTKEQSATYSDLTINVGTTRWMAPEVMRADNVRKDDVDEEGKTSLNHPFKIDIYSFAMVSYEILTGDVPFSNLNPREVRKAVLSGARPLLPRECPYRLKRLIEACWSAKASMRPSFGDICEELRDLKHASLMTYWKASFYQCPSKDITTIDELVAKLSSPVLDVQQNTTNDICLMARKSCDHWMYIRDQESVPLLIALYYSRDLKTQNHAIIALRTLSTSYRVSISRRDGLKELSQRWSNIYFSSLHKEDYLSSAIGPIVEVLKVGRMKAREYAAQALMNISSDLGVMIKEKIINSGAVPALMRLLEDGSTKGKEYAAIMLFRTCCSQRDYTRAIRVGIIPPLMNLIAQQSSTMLDDALNILVTLAKDNEGLIAIATIGFTPILVKFIMSESKLNRERAIQILLLLCLHDPQFIKEARECNVVVSLTILTKDYSPEVNALLQLLQ